MVNTHNVTEFIFLGLSPNREVQRICFVIFLLLYVAIVLGNSLIVLTVMTSRSMGSPMYFFLSYLSFVEICYSFTTALKLISDLLAERKTIPWWGCMTQLFFVHFFGGAEVFLLTVMAYDRYVAICKPLNYTTIMNQQVCMVLVGMAWVGGFVHSLSQILLVSHLPFCGPNVIDHYFCDVLPLLQLACSDTLLIGLLIVANGGTLSVISFVVIPQDPVPLMGKDILTKSGIMLSFSPHIRFHPDSPATPLILTLTLGALAFPYPLPSPVLWKGGTYHPDLEEHSH
ncbi:olfactory receptor 4X2-like [Callospermophilus lateralis]|uniref:olfactory receptor 4X2-like n=1 Tax=Callospermophilus lateralis TaxID=76772 RepID=UPI004053AEAE